MPSRQHEHFQKISSTAVRQRPSRVTKRSSQLETDNYLDTKLSFIEHYVPREHWLQVDEPEQVAKAILLTLHNLDKITVGVIRRSKVAGLGVFALAIAATVQPPLWLSQPRRLRRQIPPSQSPRPSSSLSAASRQGDAERVESARAFRNAPDCAALP